jgi:hypothetical protein
MASDKRTFSVQLTSSVYVANTSKRSYGNASKVTERKYERFQIGFPRERKYVGAWQKQKDASVT